MISDDKARDEKLQYDVYREPAKRSVLSSWISYSWINTASW